MGRPRAGYRLANGDRVPGTTTVTGLYGASKEGLVAWANRVGLEGQNYREVRDGAALLGTITHARIDAHLHGLPFRDGEFPPDVVQQSEVAFQAMHEWTADLRLTWIATELTMVSEKHRFGGTLDGVALREGKGPCLIDFKTSAGIYAEAIMQVSAYGALWEENIGEPLTGGYAIARFDKEHGGFTYKWLKREAVVVAWECFLHLRELYDRKSLLEKLAK